MKKRRIAAVITSMITFLIMLLIIIPLLIPTDTYRKEIELQITSYINLPVSIGKLGFTLFPRPRLRAYDIVISGHDSDGNIQAREMETWLSIPALLNKELLLPWISFKGVEGSTTLIQKIYAQIDNDLEEPHATENAILQIRQLVMEDVHFVTQQNRQLGPYRIEVSLNEKTEIQSLIANRHDGKMALHMAPDKDAIFFSLKGTQWTLPLGPSLQFDTLELEGELKDQSIRITSINSTGYEGHISANALISWGKNWKIEGPISMTNLQLKPLLTTFENATISGGLSSNCKVRLLASQPQDLLNTPCIKCDFEINDGTLYKADLESASKLTSDDKETTEGNTPFDKLAGHIDVKNGSIQLQQLDITSQSLQASGNVTIDPANKLEGEMEVGLKRTAGIVSVPLNISGTIMKPNLRPTSSAMAGGTVGTVILGPGLGTAIGIKAGKAISGIKKFFSRDQGQQPRLEADDSDNFYTE